MLLKALPADRRETGGKPAVIDGETGRTMSQAQMIDDGVWLPACSAPVSDRGSPNPRYPRRKSNV
jgi:hypothetical protein